MSLLSCCFAVEETVSSLPVDLRVTPFLFAGAGLEAGDLRGAGFLVADFLTGDFFAADFLAATLPFDFLAGDFFAAFRTTGLVLAAFFLNADFLRLTFFGAAFFLLAGLAFAVDRLDFFLVAMLFGLFVL